jgi:hypothetical protein
MKDCLPSNMKNCEVHIRGAFHTIAVGSRGPWTNFPREDKVNCRLCIRYKL